jgi:thiol-disulfide isomerase/thioredoxin
MRNLFAFGLVALLLLVGCSPGQEDAAAEPLPATSPDDIRTLLEQSTRPVVLNIWASWCIPCRSEAPLLERAHQQFGDEVKFVGVNVADTQAGAREFIAEFGLTFENLFDAPRAVPASLGGSGVPLTFFFEPGGELVHYQPGVIDERMLALQIDELLQRLDRG